MMTISFMVSINSFHVYSPMMNIKRSFPFYTQFDMMDCGPACLRMIAKYYGKHYTLQTLREKSYITHEGVSMLGISEAAESIGFRSLGVRINADELSDNVSLPCILHWNQNHFVVLYKIKKGRGRQSIFYIANPASKCVKYTQKEFEKCWCSTTNDMSERERPFCLPPGRTLTK